MLTTTMTPLNPSKKRKRRRVVMNDDEDDEAHIRLPRAMATVDKPPTFSASSPSSLPPPPAPVIRGELRKKKPVKGKQDTDDVPRPSASILILRKRRTHQNPKRSPASVPSRAMLDNHHLFPRLHPSPGPMSRIRRIRMRKRR